ncbi:MAG: helicase C-terminal domain-containing protein [Candidatus Bathyarchaeia archaeon]
MSIQLKPHQEYTINEIRYNVDKYDIFFVNMSTGGGKTLTVLMVYKLMMEHGIDFSLVATRTKNEYTPYFRDVVKFNFDFNCSGLIGKDESCSIDVIRTIFSDTDINPCKMCLMRSYLLDSGEVFSIVKSNISLIPIIKRNDICPYYSLKRSFINANIYCVTYPYVFTPRLFSLLKLRCDIYSRKLENALLIIDEAHNIDNVTELYDVHLTTSTIDIIEQMCKSNEILADKDEIKALKDFVNSNKSDDMKYIDKNSVPKIDLTEFYIYLSETRSIAEISRIVNKIRAVSRLVRFYSCLQRNEYDLFSYKNGLVLKIVLPTFVSNFINLFGFKIIMSGTLPPKDYINKIWMLDGLYIDVDAKYKLYSDQKIGFIISNLTTKYEYRDKYYPKYAKVISEICNLNNEVKLIVYPSYEVMKSILKLIDSKSLTSSIVEDAYTKIEFVKDEVLKGKVNIHCVAGGKLTEGIELLDNDNNSMIKYVVLVGVPYPDVNDYIKVKSKRISELIKEDNVFRYSHHVPALLLTKQAIGRAVRSERDKVKVLLLDWRYRYLIDELGLKMASKVMLNV